MALSHKNQATKALDAVNADLLTWGKDGKNVCVVNCPVCGGQRTAWLGKARGAKLASHMVCMNKGCPAKREAIKVRNEKGVKFVLDD